ncbi:MAG: hypothetical protein KatS3mg002_1197 [Candidatus Woesearchaeota archaeon]|nr:MAG: hypothetical protein KatS3mg002_1197 [Candidatus Woesearchaeota archaeon]
MIIKIDPEIVPYDNLIRGLCMTPYYGHTHGCPNYGCKEGCPPNNLIDKIFDFSKEMYIIYTTFPIGKFAERMRKNHPDWKETVYPDHPKKTYEFRDKIISKLKEKHPEWPEEYFPKINDERWTSSRDWYNPRRWQAIARKEHSIELETFIQKYPGLTINRFPEAHGINLTGLMHNIGIELSWQWPPIHNIKNNSYIVSVAGHLKKTIKNIGIDNKYRN